MIHPSLRFTTVRLLGDMRTTQTRYLCALNTRSEGRNCSGRSATTASGGMEYEYGPLRAQIHNHDLGYRFELEPATRLYTAIRVNEYGSPIWTKPQGMKPAKRSGKTVHTHIETVDTGERRELFGYASRRVVTRTIQTRDSQWLGESECDAWYIDPPAAWLLLHPPPKPGIFHHVVASSRTGKRDDYRFTEVGKRETGFVLLARRIQRSSFQDQAGNARVHESVHREHITEFSEAPLDRHLFVPPANFKRVAEMYQGMRYPYPYRTRLRWEMFKDALTLQTGIAYFVCLCPPHYSQTDPL